MSQTSAGPPAGVVRRVFREFTLHERVGPSEGIVRSVEATDNVQVAGIYLEPSVAAGSRYAFDPDSTTLRAALTHRPDGAVPSVSRADLLADLPFLRTLLEVQCASYADLCSAPGFDIDRFFDAWATSLVDLGSELSLAESVVEPMLRLQEANQDRHLTVQGLDGVLARNTRTTFREYQVKSAGPAAADLVATLNGVGDVFRSDTVRVARSMGTDGSLGWLVTGSATTASFGSTSLVDVQLVPRMDPRPRMPAGGKPVYQWEQRPGVCIVTIRSFAGSAAQRAQLDQLPLDYAQYAKSPAILFDRRDNGGGNLQYIDQWISQAVRGSWQSYAREEVPGALWPCSLWNVCIERQIREGTIESAEAKDERRSLRAGWTETMSLTSFLDTGARKGHASRPYIGKVFALVNRRTGSSGELAAVQLQQALGAHLVGERTAGAMQYGEARRFALPHTRLVVQIPTKRFTFGYPVEGVGLPVDTYLDDIDQDAGSVAESLSRWQT